MNHSMQKVSYAWMIESLEYTDQRAQYEIKNDVMAFLPDSHPVDSHLESNQSATAPTFFDKATRLACSRQ